MLFILIVFCVIISAISISTATRLKHRIDKILMLVSSLERIEEMDKDVAKTLVSTINSIINQNVSVASSLYKFKQELSRRKSIDADTNNDVSTFFNNNANVNTSTVENADQNENTFETTNQIITDNQPTMILPMQTQAQPIFEQSQSQLTFEQSQSQPIFEQAQSQPTFEQAQSQPIFEQAQSQPTFEQAQSQPTFEQSQIQPTFEQSQIQPTFEPKLKQYEFDNVNKPNYNKQFDIIKPQPKMDIGTITLILGVIFVISSALVFATSIWSTVGGVAKISILAVLGMLHMAVAFVFKKRFETDKPSLAFFVMGCTFFSSTILSYAFFFVSSTPQDIITKPSWLFWLFVFFASLSLFSGITYRLYNQKNFIYITLHSAMLGCFCLAYSMIQELSLATLVLTILTTVMVAMLHYDKIPIPEHMRKIVINFSRANLIAVATFTIACSGLTIVGFVCCVMLSVAVLFSGKSHFGDKMLCAIYIGVLFGGLFKISYEHGINAVYVAFGLNPLFTMLLVSLRLVSEDTVRKIIRLTFILSLVVYACNTVTLVFYRPNPYALISLVVLMLTITVIAIKYKINSYRYIHIMLLVAIIFEITRIIHWYSAIPAFTTNVLALVVLFVLFLVYTYLSINGVKFVAGYATRSILPFSMLAYGVYHWNQVYSYDSNVYLLITFALTTIAYVINATQTEDRIRKLHAFIAVFMSVCTCVPLAIVVKTDVSFLMSIALVIGLIKFCLNYRTELKLGKYDRISSDFTYPVLYIYTIALHFIVGIKFLNLLFEGTVVVDFLNFATLQTNSKMFTTLVSVSLFMFFVQIVVIYVEASKNKRDDYYKLLVFMSSIGLIINSYISTYCYSKMYEVKVYYALVPVTLLLIGAYHMIRMVHTKSGRFARRAILYTAIVPTVFLYNTYSDEPVYLFLMLISLYITFAVFKDIPRKFRRVLAYMVCGKIIQVLMIACNLVIGIELFLHVLYVVVCVLIATWLLKIKLPRYFCSPSNIILFIMGIWVQLEHTSTATYITLVALIAWYTLQIAEKYHEGKVNDIKSLYLFLLPLPLYYTIVVHDYYDISLNLIMTIGLFVLLSGVYSYYANKYKDIKYIKWSIVVFNVTLNILLMTLLIATENSELNLSTLMAIVGFGMVIFTARTVNNHLFNVLGGIAIYLFIARLLNLTLPLTASILITSILFGLTRFVKTEFISRNERNEIYYIDYFTFIPVIGFFVLIGDGDLSGAFLILAVVSASLWGRNFRLMGDMAVVTLGMTALTLSLLTQEIVDIEQVFQSEVNIIILSLYLLGLRLLWKDAISSKVYFIASIVFTIVLFMELTSTKDVADAVMLGVWSILVLLVGLYYRSKKVVATSIIQLLLLVTYVSFYFWGNSYWFLYLILTGGLLIGISLRIESKKKSQMPPTVDIETNQYIGLSEQLDLEEQLELVEQSDDTL